jgi:fumarate hydratase subunit beta
MNVINLTLPLKDEVLNSLKAGDKVLVSGTVFTARDAAHKRICEYLDSGKPLPFDLTGAAIFYAGPTPARPGKVCGAIGPTTSARMDRYTPRLLAEGVKVLIGKGERSVDVADAIRSHAALYLVAVGGAAALLSQCVISCETVAWEDLGAEAIRRLEVKDFPCYVAVV